ncbi:DUF2268 domain-containing putative Zn-dependent protease [Bacillus sp. CECT 9360]|uniref:DUF2268 domain-containing protein n=1 Tax=Bacillus sp. CECT 9360 TaxID=2845821 RepID=UPI001E52487C|nr:DUF2268 domain-containing putative Zn-dependent protease [Bacillus sp. CECT 9360]CAH0344475.1 hypothetical protein BCI9360_00730 [Bacillus sp. CECT 9360]
MTVINTREWLENDLANPIEMLKKCNESYTKAELEQYYEYLKRFGMYTPSAKIRQDLDRLIDKDIWGKTKQIFSKYKGLWKGTDIPVYIFPYKGSGRLLRTQDNKSGLAFKDRLFLFIHSTISDKELEAVFVHEYHHVCRLNLLKKSPAKYTLLDSIILEGLAEYAVSKHVGKDYLAKWTSLYGESELLNYYERYLKKKLQTKRSDELHDQLLLGMKPFPSMLGYCAGYYMVKNAGLIPIKKTFTISSEVFLEKME